MKKIILIATILFFAIANISIAQEHTASLKYTLPADAKVREKLADWKKIKFGLLMHWGTYSQWGIVEREKEGTATITITSFVTTTGWCG